MKSAENRGGSKSDFVRGAHLGGVRFITLGGQCCHGRVRWMGVDRAEEAEQAEDAVGALGEAEVDREHRVQGIVQRGEEQHHKVDLVEVGAAEPGGTAGDEAHGDAADYYLDGHGGEGDVLKQVEEVEPGPLRRAGSMGDVHG
jgi:hypothetical protein